MSEEYKYESSHGHGSFELGCRLCMEQVLTECALEYQQNLALRKSLDDAILNQENLIEALMDMVAQHCFFDKETGMYESGCLHANADAMRLLGRIGKMEIDDRGHRVVFGKWPEEICQCSHKKGLHDMTMGICALCGCPGFKE